MPRSALLARPVHALSLAPAWAPNYTRTACEVAETLWLLDRRDHLAVVERALRDKALPADFRFPMTDARLALARLCALDGRTDEARQWFDAARVVLDAQGARPLRAVVDHDEALMHLRAGDPAAGNAVHRRRAAGVRPARHDRLDPAAGRDHRVLLGPGDRGAAGGGSVDGLRPQCDQLATAGGEHVRRHRMREQDTHPGSSHPRRCVMKAVRLHADPEAPRSDDVREPEITGRSPRITVKIAAEPRAVLADLRAALGPSRMSPLLTDPDVVERYRHDEADWARVRRPAGGGATEQHGRGRRRRRVCARYGVPVVTRGAGTRRLRRRERRGRLRGAVHRADAHDRRDQHRRAAGGRPTGRGERRPSHGRRRARPVVPARPVERHRGRRSAATSPRTPAGCAASSTG